jgi:hypothetical protein
VGPHETDEHDAGVVLDLHDETVGVSLDVEDDPVARKEISGRIAAFDVLRPLPTGGDGLMKPGFQSGFAVGVLVIEVADRFASDDSHLKVPREGMKIKGKVPILGTLWYQA